MDLDGACVHIRGLATETHAKRRECEDYVQNAAEWVHLRTSQTCGGTRCGDASLNRHASRHMRSSEHAAICSAEPGEQWLSCHPYDNAVEY
jgi:hypothetical protein